MNIIPKEIELQNYAEEFLFQHCLEEVISLDKTYHTTWDLPYKYKGKKVQKNIMEKIDIRFIINSLLIICFKMKVLLEIFGMM